MACGMPGWKELLEKLYARASSIRQPEEQDASMQACQHAITDNRFDIAATLLRDLLLPSDFDEILQQEFGSRKLAECTPTQRASQLHRLHALTQGPWAGVITTNYDNLIETALSEEIVVGGTGDLNGRHCFHHREVAIVQGDDSRIGAILARPPAGGFLVKIHGSIAGQGVVLSSEDYGRTYLSTPRITSFLTALMLRYHLVFIGCSLEDELVRLRQKLALEFSRVIPSAYALIQQTDHNKQRAGWLRDCALIQSITYPADDHKHLSVDSFLAEAAATADWAVRREPRPAITAKLAALGLAERLAAIGEINLRLIDLISQLPRRTIDHAELVEIERLASEHPDPVLYKLSAEERVYRILFLVSIGLVNEEPDSIGVARYKIDDSIAAVAEQSQSGRVLVAQSRRKPRKRNTASGK
jgi:hypothetical protein